MDLLPIEDPKKLSTFIKDRRRKLGLTQTELAHISGLSKNGLAKFERGESSLSVSNIMRLGPNLGFRLTLDIEPLD